MPVQTALSKQLAPDADLTAMTPAELSAAHDEAHQLYTLAISGTNGVSVEEIVGAHARIVGELVTRGIAHPRPPGDLLDSTTRPQPDTPVPVPNVPTAESTAAEIEKYDATIVVPVFKLVEEKRLVMGVVLEPDQIDAHGDFEKAETIERVAHRFLAKFNEVTQLGIQHQVFGKIGLELVESYIAPMDMTINDEVIKAGSWVMVVKVVNDVTWQSVKSGAITGFSIGGVATVAATA